METTTNTDDISTARLLDYYARLEREMNAPYFAVVTNGGVVDIIPGCTQEELFARYSGSGSCIHATYGLHEATVEGREAEAEGLGVYRFAEKFK